MPSVKDYYDISDNLLCNDSDLSYVATAVDVTIYYAVCVLAFVFFIT